MSEYGSVWKGIGVNGRPNGPERSPNACMMIWHASGFFFGLWTLFGTSEKPTLDIRDSEVHYRFTIIGCNIAMR